MRHYFEELRDFFKKGDMFLLVLCLIVSGFGLVCIASATSADKFDGNFRYLAVQTVSIGLGVLMYALVSSIDVDSLSEHRGMMVAFNCFLLLLLIPLGTDHGSGNRSWLKLPLINVQPAEICKITYILIMASVMSSHQNTISHPVSVIHMGMHLILLVGLNLALSSDMGVSLIFVFIFIGMAFAGGVSLWWFAAAIGSIVAAFPVLWQFLGDYQKNRIKILFDPTIDPQGINERYHANMNLKSITGGGLTGQGLFNGNRTQGGNLFAAYGLYLLLHGRGAGLYWLRGHYAAGAGHHRPVHLRGRPMPGLYAAADLLRRRLRADVPGDDQRGHVHRRHAGYRSDPAADQLRRLLRGYHLRHAGAGFRRICPTTKPQSRTLRPALPGIAKKHSRETRLPAASRFGSLDF